VSNGPAVKFSGQANSYNDVINFKNYLESDPLVSEVNLPFTNIVRDNSGVAKFSISFQMKLGEQ